ncbi:hypothetical protein [Neobacillus drentensis]|uniref:hypothetical protein n=1 Tax=Neobacillus drentensis TaxID=220684 RepID=UPI002FFFE2F0
MGKKEYDIGFSEGFEKGYIKALEVMKTINLDVLTKILDQNSMDQVCENGFTNECSKDQWYRIMNSYNEQNRRDKATVEREEKVEGEEEHNVRVKKPNLIKPRGGRTTRLGPNSLSRATMELRRMNELLLKLLNQ